MRLKPELTKFIGFNPFAGYVRPNRMNPKSFMHPEKQGVRIACRFSIHLPIAFCTNQYLREPLPGMDNRG